jgi:hypothetical protein
MDDMGLTATSLGQSEASAPGKSASAPSCGECGGPLPPSSGGRPRLTCSDGCRRARDFRNRRIQRRLEWIAEWQASAYPRDVIRRQVRQLKDEIRAFKQAGRADAR